MNERQVGSLNARINGAGDSNPLRYPVTSNDIVPEQYLCKHDEQEF